MDVNGVEFLEEGNVPVRRREFKKNLEGVSEWLISHKIAKSPIEANRMLLAAIAVMILIAFGLLVFAERKPVGPTPAQKARFDAMYKHR
ncbi:MAG: hypothetical protein JWL82_213 [Parcubacteria group bacterium]|nr:hypothetical protein [Parcubacteria group bacterium]